MLLVYGTFLPWCARADETIFETDLCFLKYSYTLSKRNRQFIHVHAINTKKLNLIAHLVTPEETTGNAKPK